MALTAMATGLELLEILASLPSETIYPTLVLASEVEPLVAGPEVSELTEAPVAVALTTTPLTLEMTT